MPLTIPRGRESTALYSCAICGNETNVYKCSQCGRRVCESDYSKRHALDRECAQEAGIELQRDSFFRSIFR